MEDVSINVVIRMLVIFALSLAKFRYALIKKLVHFLVELPVQSGHVINIVIRNFLVDINILQFVVKNAPQSPCVKYVARVKSKISKSI